MQKMTHLLVIIRLHINITDCTYVKHNILTSNILLTKYTFIFMVHLFVLTDLGLGILGFKLHYAITQSCDKGCTAVPIVKSLLIYKQQKSSVTIVVRYK